MSVGSNREGDLAHQLEFALHLAAIVLAACVAWLIARSLGFPPFAARFVVSVFALVWFVLEFILGALIPSVIESIRMRRVLEEDERRLARAGHSTADSRDGGHAS